MCFLSYIEKVKKTKDDLKERTVRGERVGEEGGQEKIDTIGAQSVPVWNCHGKPEGDLECRPVVQVVSW